MNSFQNQSEHRNGFTLVELLLVMAIIAVLASLSLVVVNSAQEDARRSATQARISLLHNVLLTRMENYETVRLPFNIADFVVNDPDFFLVNARQIRRRVIMDLISSELPRNVADAAFYPSGRFEQWAEDAAIVHDPDGLSQTMLGFRTPNSMRFASIGNPAANEPTIPDPPSTDQQRAQLTAANIRTSSEYLYFILQTTQTAGQSGLEIIGDRGVADSDGDGFLEIVDSWGNPISFRLEMFDDFGRRVENRLAPTANPPLPVVAAFDPGFGGIGSDTEGGVYGPPLPAPEQDANQFPTLEFGVVPSNIKLRLISTNGIKPDRLFFDGPSSELITN